MISAENLIQTIVPNLFACNGIQNWIQIYRNIPGYILVDSRTTGIPYLIGLMYLALL